MYHVGRRHPTRTSPITITPHEIHIGGSDRGRGKSTGGGTEDKVTHRPHTDYEVESTKGDIDIEPPNSDQFHPLSFIDDANSAPVGKETTMDQALQAASDKYRYRWDAAKNWMNKIYLAVHLNKPKH